jgi:MORN repeat
LDFFPHCKTGQNSDSNARPYRFLILRRKRRQAHHETASVYAALWRRPDVLAPPAMSHDCRVRDAYLRGAYEGECNECTELAQGKGEAKGADTYVGYFAKGRPDGKGIYTWESGARLDGSFKEGKAHGPAVYVSKGVRYEAQFVNGKLGGLKTADCPSTPGLLTC